MTMLVIGLVGRIGAGKSTVARLLADLGRRPAVVSRGYAAAPGERSDEAAELAVKTGVHLVGASSLAAGHLTLVPELKAELARLGRPDILVVVGGVIPPEDFDALREAGVAAIFTPGTVVPEAAIEVMDRLNEALGYAQLKG
jgi:methylmalonyl-CoA mutase cobalamin-binding domain/chain